MENTSLMIKDKNEVLIKTELVSVRPRLKSSSFNRTILGYGKTKDTVSKCIKYRFESYVRLDNNNPIPLYSVEQDELIKTALNLGLTELASELTLLMEQ